jgi:recombinational DNA repair protein RecT
MVRNISANVVYERDAFDILMGTEQKVVHRPAHGERGSITGAYAIADLGSGMFEVEYMSMDDLDKIKRVALSRGKSPAWDQWESEMMRKAPIRRLCKRLPMGSDYAVGQAIEQAHEDGGRSEPIIDALTDGEASRGESASQRSTEMRDQVEKKDTDEPSFDPTDVRPEDR